MVSQSICYDVLNSLCHGAQLLRPGSQMKLEERKTRLIKHKCDSNFLLTMFIQCYLFEVESH